MEDLSYESISTIKDIRSFVWADSVDFLKKYIIPYLEKISFLKTKIEFLQKYLNKNNSSELTYKKNNFKRYIKRFFFHLKLLIISKWKEERTKRLKSIKKTFFLILTTYTSLSSLKKKINTDKKNYLLEFSEWNFKLYKELRFITSLVLLYYFIYLIFIDLWIRKWIFINYKLWYFTISSSFILSLLLWAFLLNLFSLIKIKFFLKNIFFNIISWIFFIWIISFYLINY